MNTKPAKQMTMTGIALSLILCTTGCYPEKMTEGDTATTATPAPAASTDTASSTAPAGGTSAGGVTAGTGGPMAGGPMMGGNPMAPLTPTPALDKAIADAEKKGDKKAIAVAYLERGKARRTDTKAGPRVMYRAALSDFRKVLKADPANKEAKALKDEIEGIYTQMGRPIPTE